MDFGARREALRPLVAAADADAMLVTSLANVRYLTGFTGSNAALLVGVDGTDVVATDGRYATQIGAESPDLPAVVDRAVAPALAARASGRLAFEAHVVTVEAHETLVTAADDAVLVASGRLVERLRAVKDEDEIALLREACAVADRALADLLPRIAAGMTEREVALALDDGMRRHGADAPAFDTIVAAGEMSAEPHHNPTDRPLARGDLLKIDFGALLGGYHSDMTRTFVLGEPAQWQRDLHALVAAAQRAGREALTPGVTAGAVDDAAREVVVAAGEGPQFSHPLGHGVGLEIHEAPLLGPGVPVTLDERTPVTVEPGVYLPGRGGVRIEDTLVVRADGPELLTMTTKDLLVL